MSGAGLASLVVSVLSFTFCWETGSGSRDITGTGVQRLLLLIGLLTLPFAAGSVAMAVFAGGRGGKLVSPSSRGGDG